MTATNDRVLQEVEAARDELVDFTAELIRIPTVNPPGDGYRECAEAIGRRLADFGFEVDYYEAEGRPEHSAEHPRVNVVGARNGRRPRPLVHLNGHFDVVPPGDGWTVDPFAGVVEGGRLIGRGSADMKAGLASAIFAAEALRRAGVELAGTIEVSGTVDEESGGFAGVAHLAEIGRIAAGRTDHVIIPEPLNVDRICLGHRGVYWFEIACQGRIAHGCMPFLGANAIEHMGTLLEEIRRRISAPLEGRVTAMPIVPEAARRATLNINAITGGQAGEAMQTPCVADRCTAIFDRRFLIEEGFEATRAEVAGLLEEASRREPSVRFELTDQMVVHPIQTAADDPLVRSLSRSIDTVLGRRPELVASPGTYDQKHVVRLGGVESCVAYGPGELEQAHQGDESCSIDDMVDAAKVMALTLLELVA